MALIPTEERNYLLYYGFDHFKNLKHEEAICQSILNNHPSCTALD